MISHVVRPRELAPTAKEGTSVRSFASVNEAVATQVRGELERLGAIRITAFKHSLIAMDTQVFTEGKMVFEGLVAVRFRANKLF
jgi:hypothetical protein